MPQTAYKAVVTGTALDCVIATTTIEQVVSAIANEGIAQSIAGAIEMGVAQQRQAFDIAAQAVVDAGLYGVVATVGSFHHDVAEVVDQVGVVAEAAFQAVGTAATIQQVVTAIAD
ncbi:hypothetical protein D3C75_922970 [compost metagenome]